MDSQDAYYKDIIDLFRLAYNKKLLTEQAMGRGGNCGHTGEEPCDTGEVVITVPKPGGPKGDPNLYLPGANPGSGDPGVIGGGCGMYGDCGGGGSDSGSQSSADKIDIEKLKDFPCAYDIAQQLPNLSNDLAKLLKNTFGSSDKINVTFIPKDGMDPKKDGYTAGGGSVQGGRLNATIYLNADMLKKASKEYILVTMYHEVTHAYLYAERIRLGSKEAFEAQYPKIECYDVTTPNGEVIQRFTFINENSSDSHPRFTSFINLLENALSAYNPSLSKDIIKALVKTGIFSDLTNQENKLNQNERDTSTGQSKGTKCP